jgi:flavin-dependent dehydrogenase
MYGYDMLVIGSGPSGCRAAVQFAKLGRSVLVVESGNADRTASDFSGFHRQGTDRRIHA